jgi:hypothetical protein
MVTGCNGQDENGEREIKKGGETPPFVLS